MRYQFSPRLRSEFADRCGAFPRVVYEGPALKRAAVTIALIEADDGSSETALLLTKRAEKMRTHSGQWALPGGRCDDGESLEATALRELHEELALKAGPENILGVLDDYASRSGYVIAPVVVWLDDLRALRANPDEVASIHRIRLDNIAHPSAVEFTAIPESPRPVIRLRFGEHHIHAPTAALLYQFRELAAGRITRVSHFEQPVFAWR